MAKNFGNTNICIYFDYFPAPYILPIIYAINVITAIVYVNMSIMRVYVAWTQGHGILEHGWGLHLLNFFCKNYIF